jgi:hypothetical protein
MGALNAVFGYLSDRERNKVLKEQIKLEHDDRVRQLDSTLKALGIKIDAEKALKQMEGEQSKELEKTRGEFGIKQERERGTSGVRQQKAANKGRLGEMEKSSEMFGRGFQEYEALGGNTSDFGIKKSTLGRNASSVGNAIPFFAPEATKMAPENFAASRSADRSGFESAPFRNNVMPVPSGGGLAVNRGGAVNLFAQQEKPVSIFSKGRPGDPNAVQLNEMSKQYAPVGAVPYGNAPAPNFGLGGGAGGGGLNGADLGISRPWRMPGVTPTTMPAAPKAAVAPTTSSSSMQMPPAINQILQMFGLVKPQQQASTPGTFTTPPQSLSSTNQLGGAPATKVETDKGTATPNKSIGSFDSGKPLGESLTSNINDVIRKLMPEEANSFTDRYVGGSYVPKQGMVKQGASSAMGGLFSGGNKAAGQPAVMPNITGSVGESSKPKLTDESISNAPMPKKINAVYQKIIRDAINTQFPVTLTNGVVEAGTIIGGDENGVHVQTTNGVKIIPMSDYLRMAPAPR